MVTNIDYQTESEKTTEIPKSLIKEIINPTPYYYKNYQKVLFYNQSLESIVGKSRFQALIISSLMIWGSLFRENYRVLGNLRLDLDETDFVILPLAFFKNRNCHLKSLIFAT